ncbi:hypothetical protein [Pectinatus frisingensis]|uniref:hypothetical protein n=1 Tax=Pectinatus frisingensis TaxID=865 RepID=UPI0018C6773F|nr:hypothetical protein [Pectinatus frisingensis]
MESKKIHWIFKRKTHEGFANLTSGKIVLCNDSGAIFDSILQKELIKGTSLKDVFDKIPADITDFDFHNLQNTRGNFHGMFKKDNYRRGDMHR